MTGFDQTGIDLSAVRRNGVQVLGEDRPCDFTRPAPCANPGGQVARSWDVDTATWADGSYTLTGVVTDAGGNRSVTPGVAVKVDNTAPQAPSDLASDSGEGWSGDAARELSWSLPVDGGSPVASASVSVCSVLGQCSIQAAASATRATVTLPADGTFTATVQLTDAAGNTSAANTAATTLRLDRSAPPAPVLQAPRADPSTGEVVVPVDFSNDPGPAPVVAAGGELCRADGTSCQPLPAQQRVSEVRLTLPGDGDWLVRARVVDAAGNVGAAGSRIVSRPAPVPTATPGGEPTPGTPGPAASATPTATPTATPRKPVTVRVRALRLGRRQLRLRVALPQDATGRVTVTFRPRRGTRTVRRVHFRGGTLKLRLPARDARRGKVSIAYAGNATYAPAAVTKRVRR